MIAQAGHDVCCHRRHLFAALVALALSRAEGVFGGAVEREAIATVLRDDGLLAPLMLAMGRVVLQPGAAVWATTPAGARMIVVESGVLAVEATTRNTQPLSPAEFSVIRTGPVAHDELLIPAGTTMTFGAASVASVRNPGVRPVVALDVAVYTGEPRPLARAFTTDDGVSFQLLASTSANAAPRGAVEVALEQVRLGERAAMPDDLSQGLTLLYLESGTLEVVTEAGDISVARAAASAPYSVPGALRPVPPRTTYAVTAGGVVFLALGAAATIGNAGRRMAEVLALALREAR